MLVFVNGVVQNYRYEPVIFYEYTNGVYIFDFFKFNSFDYIVQIFLNEIVKSNIIQSELIIYHISFIFVKKLALELAA